MSGFLERPEPEKRRSSPFQVLSQTKDSFKSYLSRAGSRSTFKYKLLNIKRNEIRLLKLESPREPGEIRGRLLSVSLDDHPKYEALSYTWGNLNEPQKIILDGDSFVVTDNLMAALQQLSQRRGASASLIWIDAICINQLSISERNEQYVLSVLKVIVSRHLSASREIFCVTRSQLKRGCLYTNGHYYVSSKS